jgi:hypothetical protein
MKFGLMFKGLTLVALIASLFNTVPAFAVDIPEAEIGISDKDETVLVINGGIGANTGAVFKQALNENPKVKTILLNSGGGYVDIGLGMADLIANRGLSTWIPAETTCASICSAIYFAGKNRMVQGQLGVHQVAMDVDNNVATQMTLSDMFDALNRYGVDQKVFAVMLRTPPQQMYFLNQEEIVLWNVDRGVVLFQGVVQGRANDDELLPDLFPDLKSPEELFGNDQQILKGLKLN